MSTSILKVRGFNLLHRQIICSRLIRRFSNIIDDTQVQDTVKYTDFKNKNYRLPDRQSNSLVLDIINKHQLDNNLCFDNDQNALFDGGIIKSTVKAEIDKYFQQFNADEVIERMMNGENWPRKGYTYRDGKPFTANTIKKKWNEMYLYSNNRDLFLKFNITNCLNTLEYSTDIIELKHFKNFYENEFEGKGLLPYRSYWNIIDINTNLLSTVDCLSKLPEGDYVLFKFIISKKVIKEEENNNKAENSEIINKPIRKMALSPINHMEDNELTKESLQMNYNKYILEKFYDIKVSKMKLVNFHSHLEKYQVIDIDNYSEEIENIIEDIKK